MIGGALIEFKLVMVNLIGIRGRDEIHCNHVDRLYVHRLPLRIHHHLFQVVFSTSLTSLFSLRYVSYKILTTSTNSN